MFTEERRYDRDKCYILNVICDLIEMLHGQITFEDNKTGRLGFRSQMYDLYSNYLFIVTPAGDESCTVRLETRGFSDSGEEEDRLSFQTFALLDARMARRFPPGEDSA